MTFPFRRASGGISSRDDTIFLNPDWFGTGIWTPDITFDTPGNLSVAYSARSGRYERLGRLVHVAFSLTTSTFTHTTASGNLRITGLPIVPFNDNVSRRGPLGWGGITKVGYTDIALRLLPTDSFLTVFASGSGLAQANVTAIDMPTIGTVTLAGNLIYTTS